MVNLEYERRFVARQCLILRGKDAIPSSHAGDNFEASTGMLRHLKQGYN